MARRESAAGSTCRPPAGLLALLTAVWMTIAVRPTLDRCPVVISALVAGIGKTETRCPERSPRPLSAPIGRMPHTDGGL